jgi:hypothetical protein
MQDTRTYFTAQNSYGNAIEYFRKLSTLLTYALKTFC